MGKVAVDLAAVLLAKEPHRTIFFQQLDKDGWEVWVYSALPKAWTRHTLQRTLLSHHVDGVLWEEPEELVNDPAQVSYGFFKGECWTGRRLTLPIALSYG